METYTVNSIDELSPIAKKLVLYLNHIPVVALYGPMGVGKTTFIKEVCRALDVSDTVNSPSFAIVNEYRDAKDEPVFHFDLYRLKHADELTNHRCLGKEGIRHQQEPHPYSLHHIYRCLLRLSNGLLMTHS